MGRLPRIQSDYALLDVKRGRYALAKRLRDEGPQRVTVEMVINYRAGNDDGTSIEFAADVLSVIPAPIEESDDG